VTANLADLLSRAAAEAGDQVALVDAATGEETTWAALDDQVSRFAGGLEEQGLVAGNRVAIATANRAEFVVAYLAVLRARLVAVPVNPRSATGELLRMVTDSGARLLLADRTTVDAARAVVAGLADAVRTPAPAPVAAAARPVVPRLAVLDTSPEAGEIGWDRLLAADPRRQPETRDAEALAVLLYTSGATAAPRAAMLSHRALLANIEQVARLEPRLVGPDDVVYGVLPLFHVYGLNAVLGQVLRQHARLVVVDAFEPAAALDDIERYGATVVPVAPPVLAHWRRVEDLATRLRGVRVLLSGSAPLAPEVVVDLESRFGLRVHQGYGLTEAAPVVTSTLASAALKPGSVGAALPGVTLRLVDETGATPSGEDPGEILVAGDNLFDGYWPDGADAPVDGWLATGDVGFLDADGDLFLVDRLKELVIVSGFNVYPREVEEALLEVEGVLEAAVVGVADEETGEAVAAYLRVADGLDEAGRAALLERVAEECGHRLARFKRPTRIELVDELPRTASGKIAKGRLRSTLRRERLGLLE
jgi:long-chain acyl-CoA synthetase